MGIRFIGNKQRMLPFIVDRIQSVAGHDTNLVFADMFTGTASVARQFKALGYRVIANDRLASSAAFATAALLVSHGPSFERLRHVENIPLDTNRLLSDPLDAVLTYLAGLSGVEGFFCRTYAPTGSSATGTLRQYFTDANAKKIDAIRLTIRHWWERELIDVPERALLLSSLMLGVNGIANVAGTYGFFLSKWYERALAPLSLPRPRITPGRIDHCIIREDANTLASSLRADIVYLDPPYTKRQYSAYYHILETLAEDDEPIVWGLTGLRPRNDEAGWSSRYCYKRKASAALCELVSALDCRYIFLSYSSDGHIAHEHILDILGTRGSVKHWSVPLQRYRSNNGGNGHTAVSERLYCVQCDG